MLTDAADVVLGKGRNRIAGDDVNLSGSKAVRERRFHIAKGTLFPPSSCTPVMGRNIFFGLLF